MISPRQNRKKTIPSRETIFVIIENAQGEVLLQQRPPSGIWGGLWCFPEFSVDAPISDEIKKKYGFNIKQQVEYKTFKHTFSHFHLMIKPIHIKLAGRTNRVNEAGISSTWLNPDKTSRLGFPAPVVSLLEDLNNKRMSE